MRTQSIRWAITALLLSLFVIFRIGSVQAVWADTLSSANQQSPSPLTTTTPSAQICSVNDTLCEPDVNSTAAQTSGAGVYEKGDVRVVVFWMEGCPHCEEVLNKFLPSLETTYGDRLEVNRVEIKGLQAVDQLYQLGTRLGLPKEDIGVPFLMLGDQFLSGDQMIETELSGLVDRAFAQGGVDFPAIPEFNIYPGEASGQMHSGQGSAKNKIAIYLFWGDGCPHCAVAKPFLQELDQGSEQIELRMYEVWYVEENQALFTEMAAAYGFEPHAVPTIFIGAQFWEGYNDQIQNEIQAAVDGCLVEGCVDAGVGIIPGVIAPEIAPEPPTSDPVAATPGEKQLDIPILGSINLSAQPLFVSTLLIAFVDGFNPCSVWVLTMLMALTLHTGSRKKVLLIGLVFLTVTAAIYGVFIAGLFTMFKVVSFVGWIQAAVAVVALFFALVNIKDYFWYKEGVSFTISDNQKPGIFQRMRRLMDASQSIWGLVGGAIVLAAGVSLVEFSCTAGFPVLWSNLLVSQNVSTITFVALLLVYLLIYQLDELGIFAVAVFTMRASKLEEKQGRILKLIGGMLMLSLAGVMLINPDIMNDLTSSIIVFGIAFGATMIVLLVHRVILPKFGIRIGSEFKASTSSRQRQRK